MGGMCAKCSWDMQLDLALKQLQCDRSRHMVEEVAREIDLLDECRLRAMLIHAQRDQAFVIKGQPRPSGDAGWRARATRMVVAMDDEG